MRAACVAVLAACVSCIWSLLGLYSASLSTGELKVRGTFAAETALFTAEDPNYSFKAQDVSAAHGYSEAYATKLWKAASSSDIGQAWEGIVDTWTAGVLRGMGFQTAVQPRGGVVALLRGPGGGADTDSIVLSAFEPRACWSLGRGSNSTHHGGPAASLVDYAWSGNGRTVCSLRHYYGSSTAAAGGDASHPPIIRCTQNTAGLFVLLASLQRIAASPWRAKDVVVAILPPPGHSSHLAPRCGAAGRGVRGESRRAHLPLTRHTADPSLLLRRRARQLASLLSVSAPPPAAAAAASRGGDNRNKPGPHLPPSMRLSAAPTSGVALAWPWGGAARGMAVVPQGLGSGSASADMDLLHKLVQDIAEPAVPRARAVGAGRGVGGGLAGVGGGAGRGSDFAKKGKGKGKGGRARIGYGRGATPAPGTVVAGSDHGSDHGYGAARSMMTSAGALVLDCGRCQVPAGRAGERGGKEGSGEDSVQRQWRQGMVVSVGDLSTAGGGQSGDGTALQAWMEGGCIRMCGGRTTAAAAAETGTGTGAGTGAVGEGVEAGWNQTEVFSDLEAEADPRALASPQEAAHTRSRGIGRELEQHGEVSMTTTTTTTTAPGGLAVGLWALVSSLRHAWLGAAQWSGLVPHAASWQLRTSAEGLQASWVHGDPGQLGHTSAAAFASGRIQCPVGSGRHRMPSVLDNWAPGFEPRSAPPLDLDRIATVQCDQFRRTAAEGAHLHRQADRGMGLLPAVSRNIPAGRWDGGSSAMHPLLASDAAAAVIAPFLTHGVDLVGIAADGVTSSITRGDRAGTTGNRLSLELRCSPLATNSTGAVAPCSPMDADLAYIAGESGKQQVRAVGRTVVQYFRMLNGLEERPHAGQPFYLLSGPSRFVGQSEVVLLVAVAVVPLLLAALLHAGRASKGRAGYGCGNGLHLGRAVCVGLLPLLLVAWCMHRIAVRYVPQELGVATGMAAGRLHSSSLVGSVAGPGMGEGEGEGGLHMYDPIGENDHDGEERKEEEEGARSALFVSTATLPFSGISPGIAWTEHTASASTSTAMDGGAPAAMGPGVLSLLVETGGAAAAAGLASLRSASAMLGELLRVLVSGRAVATSRMGMGAVMRLAGAGCDLGSGEPVATQLRPAVAGMLGRDWRRLCRLASTAGVTSVDSTGVTSGWLALVETLSARAILAQDPLLPPVATAGGALVAWVAWAADGVAWLAGGADPVHAPRNVSVELLFGASLVSCSAVCLLVATAVLQPGLAVAADLSWAWVVQSSARSRELRLSREALDRIDRSTWKGGAGGDYSGAQAQTPRTLLRQILWEIMPDPRLADVLLHRRAAALIRSVESVAFARDRLGAVAGADHRPLMVPPGVRQAARDALDRGFAPPRHGAYGAKDTASSETIDAASKTGGRDDPHGSQTGASAATRRRDAATAPEPVHEAVPLSGYDALYDEGRALVEEGIAEGFAGAIDPDTFDEWRLELPSRLDLGNGLEDEEEEEVAGLTNAGGAGRVGKGGGKLVGQWGVTSAAGAVALGLEERERAVGGWVWSLLHLGAEEAPARYCAGRDQASEEDAEAKAIKEGRDGESGSQKDSGSDGERQGKGPWSGLRSSHLTGMANSRVMSALALPQPIGAEAGNASAVTSADLAAWSQAGAMQRILGKAQPGNKSNAGNSGRAGVSGTSGTAAPASVTALWQAAVVLLCALLGTNTLLHLPIGVVWVPWIALVTAVGTLAVYGGCGCRCCGCCRRPGLGRQAHHGPGIHRVTSVLRVLAAGLCASPVTAVLLVGAATGLLHALDAAAGSGCGVGAAGDSVVPAASRESALAPILCLASKMSVGDGMWSGVTSVLEGIGALSQRASSAASGESGEEALLMAPWRVVCWGLLPLLVGAAQVVLIAVV